MAILNTNTALIVRLVLLIFVEVGIHMINYLIFRLFVRTMIQSHSVNSLPHFFQVYQ